MKDENFIVVQGWMMNKLNLKGNPLLVFAIIYGFSQDGKSRFTGSLDYMMKAINTSKNTVLKAISDLEDLNYIVKEQKPVNNVVCNEYYHNEKEVVQKLNHQKNDSSEIEQVGSEIEPPTSSEIEPNNISLKNSDNMNNDETVFSLFPKEEIEPISKIVLKYLNEKKPSNTPFQFTDTNIGFVEARIKENFKLNDFKKVIDFKIQEWKDNDKMKKFIRPETLFGTKFNRYLVEANNFKPSGGDGSTNFEYSPSKTAQLK